VEATEDAVPYSIRYPTGISTDDDDNVFPSKAVLLGDCYDSWKKATTLFDSVSILRNARVTVGQNHET
jgi:hypothetical protein